MRGRRLHDRNDGISFSEPPCRCQRCIGLVVLVLRLTDSTFYTQGKDKDADPLLIRATSINEEALGPDHPGVASTLNIRAVMLESQVRESQQL